MITNPAFFRVPYHTESTLYTNICMRRDQIGKNQKPTPTFQNKTRYYLKFPIHVLFSLHKRMRVIPKIKGTGTKMWKIELLFHSALCIMPSLTSKPEKWAQGWDENRFLVMWWDSKTKWGFHKSWSFDSHFWCLICQAQYQRESRLNNLPSKERYEIRRK